MIQLFYLDFFWFRGTSALNILLISLDILSSYFPPHTLPFSLLFHLQFLLISLQIASAERKKISRQTTGTEKRCKECSTKEKQYNRTFFSTSSRN